MTDKTKTAKSVVLRPAFAWDCDACGRESFSRAVAPEFSSEQLESLREDQGIEPWETGDFVTMPATVKCCHCGAEFDTMHFEG